MDFENKNVEQEAKHEPKQDPKRDNKIRHNRRNGNDLWVHIDTDAAEKSYQSILTAITSIAVIGLIGVTALQFIQTDSLVKQNSELMAKYEQLVTSNNANMTEALEDLENGMNAIANSIGNVRVNGSGVVSGDATVGDNTAEIPTQTPVEDDGAFFGVSVINNDTAITPLGLRIAGVYEHSPAANAGLREGDIIMSIDGTNIDTFDTMSGIIDTKAPGDTMNVRFARTQDNTVYFETVEVTLDRRSNFDTGE